MTSAGEAVVAESRSYRNWKKSLQRGEGASEKGLQDGLEYVLDMSSYSLQYDNLPDSPR